MTRAVFDKYSEIIKNAADDEIEAQRLEQEYPHDEVWKILKTYDIFNANYNLCHEAYLAAFEEIRTMFGKTPVADDEPISSDAPPNPPKKRGRKAPKEDIDRDTACVLAINNLLKNAGNGTIIGVVKNYGKTRIARILVYNYFLIFNSRNRTEFADKWADSLEKPFTDLSDALVLPVVSESAGDTSGLKTPFSDIVSAFAILCAGKSEIPNGHEKMVVTECGAIAGYDRAGKRLAVFLHDGSPYYGKLSHLYNDASIGLICNGALLFPRESPFYDNSDHSAVKLQGGAELVKILKDGYKGTPSNVSKFEEIISSGALNKKSETPRIGDSGVSIIGARKVKEREKRLKNIETVMTRLRENEFTDEEIAQLTHKDAIWTRPDYRSLIAEGLPPLVAYYIKFVRDKIPVKLPKETRIPARETAQSYAQFLRDLQEDIAENLRKQGKQSAFRRFLLKLPKERISTKGLPNF